MHESITLGYKANPAQGAAPNAILAHLIADRSIVSIMQCT